MHLVLYEMYDNITESSEKKTGCLAIDNTIWTDNHSRNKDEHNY